MKKKTEYLVKFYVPLSLAENCESVNKLHLFIKENLWKYFDEKIEIISDSFNEEIEPVDKNQFKSWIFKIKANNISQLKNGLKEFIEDFKKNFNQCPLYMFITSKDNLQNFYNAIIQRLKLIEGEKLLYFPKYRTFYLENENGTVR